jgi:hypothetical protein
MIDAQGIPGFAACVSAVTLLAASPITSIARTIRKKKHPVDVKVAAILSGCELPHRLCGVNHMQDAEPIVIAHIGLERRESLLL